MDLKQLRGKIDDIDGQILSLFLERMEVCRDVADYKRENNLPVFQGGREDEVISHIKAMTGDPALEDGTAALFTTIMDISKHLQNQSLLREAPDYEFTVPDFEGAASIGCQGTSSANSEAAARLIFGEKPLKFYRSFEDVFKAVESGKIEYGVLPIHNSTAGSVTSTYDLMGQYSVYIVKTVCVEINHCIAAASDIPPEEISCVYSHPQALTQCADFITAHGLKTKDYSNTATAAKLVKSSSPQEKIAAICSKECAERLGLHIISDKVADCPVNRTKFICISRSLQVMPDADTISVMLKIPHTQGSLYRLLTKFYVNGMNLQKLESRPVRDGSFEVMFYLDFNGRVTDKSVKTLLTDLSGSLEYFRFLGTSREA
ncbi:MAG: chorismate mutase [Ruminococcus sp.]|nr:chorismate mutase [Ruminococcus sp.]